MTVDESYFAFLLQKVGETEHIRLCKFLYETEFIYPAEIISDANRAADGIELRYEFIVFAGEGVNNVASDERLGELLPKPCSVLEMLVALAIRIDRDIMGEPSINNTQFWFRSMLTNIGAYSDAIGLVRKRVMHWLNREYDERGSMFRLQHPYRDQRKIGIWEQMSDYVNELNTNGGF
jgi:hypothetical protein